MSFYDGNSGSSGSKLALKEFSVFFIILLIIVGVFSLIAYKYNSKVDMVAEGILNKTGASSLAINAAEKKADAINTEIEIAKSNVARVNDLLRQEKINLSLAKKSAIAEVEALEKELALVDVNIKRVEGLLNKEREILAEKKAAAITEVDAKEAELKAEHERIEALYNKEIERLDKKKAKAIALVADKEAEIEVIAAESETAPSTEKLEAESLDDGKGDINLSKEVDQADDAIPEKKIDVTKQEADVTLSAAGRGDRSEIEEKPMFTLESAVDDVSSEPAKELFKLLVTLGLLLSMMLFILFIFRMSRSQY